jgi:uncharacterized protein (DUF2252 family)
MSTSRRSVDTDAVERIAVFNANGDRNLLGRQFDEMARDASSFLRATVHLFRDRLAAIGLPPSPLAFGCGDLHIENFGAYLADNRLAYFDQSEFGEAALVPVAAEMVRFVASIMVALRLHEPDDLDPKRSAKQALEAYAQALAEGKPLWIERDLARGTIEDLVSGVSRRTRRDDLDLFTRSGRRGRRKLLRDGRRSAPLTKEGRAIEGAVKNLLGAIGKERGERGFWKLRDLAQCAAAKDSLGRPRYIALIKGHGDPDGNFLLEIKPAGPSAAPVAAETLAAEKAAERVVFVQRLMQARTPAFLQPAILLDRPFVFHELQPAEDRLEIDALLAKPRRFAATVEGCARIVAWNQLRAAGRKGASDVDALIDFAMKDDWQRELLAAAGECAAMVERDYASFETAWRKRDGCLSALANLK